jgi:hypothetical protein
VGIATCRQKPHCGGCGDGLLEPRDQRRGTGHEARPAMTDHAAAGPGAGYFFLGRCAAVANATRLDGSPGGLGTCGFLDFLASLLPFLLLVMRCAQRGWVCIMRLSMTG